MTQDREVENQISDPNVAQNVNQRFATIPHFVGRNEDVFVILEETFRDMVESSNLKLALVNR